MGTSQPDRILKTDLSRMISWNVWVIWNDNLQTVFGIVMDEEAWTYECDPETKCQAAIWIFTDYMHHVKVKRSRSIEKRYWFLSFQQFSYICHENWNSTHCNYTVEHNNLSHINDLEASRNTVMNTAVAPQQRFITYVKYSISCRILQCIYLLIQHIPGIMQLTLLPK
jgi:hypothetical protein